MKRNLHHNLRLDYKDEKGGILLLSLCIGTDANGISKAKRKVISSINNKNRIHLFINSSNTYSQV